ncbi:stathmin domain-containing protein 1 [Stegastes partitus]|uniref:Stathmin domain-containing protein 1 n=1 Tax=Stegastes partitus TaxID=144197 RepID=A0A9Y4TYX8_9TELE|nr:PREDICTED: stathmin domain-containing protein 1 [Stegastes partitus]
MGCGSSTQTTVRPLTAGELNGDQDETGSKLGGRGDSAVSKGTTDSGVVMENREIPVLPGAVSTKLLPLTSETVRESEANRITQDCLLRRDSTVQERPKSSEILEELLNQGIISVGQSREKGSGAPEAYSIMLDDREGVRRRPPARLESLKAKKTQSLRSREEIDEKMRLAEERRKVQEDELKTRLRTKSARVRGPALVSSVEEDEDASLTPVEPLRSLLIPDATPAPLLHSQIAGEAAEGRQWVRQAGMDGRGDEGGGESRDNRGAEGGSEDGEREEEELTQVEELKAGQLLSASGELESDSSFHRAEDNEEMF